ncbi:hypothetical protein H6P81_004038 [Aristolochia fimbriata]|uniref:Uncharacterized protein n=1 Tax=Aristolochia fimbriata TaxID=158543 RepID=A0AAV7FE94_ARIFI|nr:hypothetical protein H6P81_004038 [Aristolochia fimbriata]
MMTSREVINGREGLVKNTPGDGKPTEAMEIPKRNRQFSLPGEDRIGGRTPDFREGRDDVAAVAITEHGGHSGAIAVPTSLYFSAPSNYCTPNSKAIANHNSISFVDSKAIAVLIQKLLQSRFKSYCIATSYCSLNSKALSLSSKLHDSIQKLRRSAQKSTIQYKSSSEIHDSIQKLHRLAQKVALSLPMVHPKLCSQRFSSFVKQHKLNPLAAVQSLPVPARGGSRVGMEVSIDGLGLPKIPSTMLSAWSLLSGVSPTVS